MAASPMRSAEKFHSVERSGQRNAGGLVFCGVIGQQQSQPLLQRGRVLGHFERRQSRFGEGTILECLEVENQAFFLAVGAAYLFVEALAGFVAEPAAFHDLLEDGGEAALG